MIIVSNERLIKRNARIGQYASLAGLAVLLGGAILSFQNPELFAISWGALLLGFGLSQVGIYYGGRWGRRPRPDEVLNEGLKGLDDRFTLFHYTTPTAHLLVGPPGLWVLMPRNQSGKITYERNRWRVRGGGFVQSYLRLFAQEGIGRPDLEVPNETQVVTRYLKKHLPEVELPEVQAALVFINERAELAVDEAPTPSLHIKKLKEYIRKTGKATSLSAEKARQVVEAFGYAPESKAKPGEES